MLIEYTRTNHHCLAYRPLPGSDQKDSPNYHLNVKEIDFLPGINEIDDDIWTEAKLAVPKIVKQYIEDDIFIEHGALDEGELPSEKAMVKFVKNCVSEKLLKKFKKIDSRDSVQEAVAAQFEKLEATLTRAREARARTGNQVAA